MAINRAAHARKKGRALPPDEPPGPAQVDVFIAVYAETLSKYEARKQAGITRKQLQALLLDPEVLDRIREVTEDLIDRAEDAAWRRAINSSDKDLLKLLLAAHRPEEYGNRQTVTLKIDVTKLSDEELEDLIAKYNRK